MYPVRRKASEEKAANSNGSGGGEAEGGISKSLFRIDESVCCISSMA